MTGQSRYLRLALSEAPLLARCERSRRRFLAGLSRTEGLLSRSAIEARRDEAWAVPLVAPDWTSSFRWRAVSM